MTEDELQLEIEGAIEEVAETGNDTSRFTQVESAEFFEGVASDLNYRAQLIRSEIG